MPHAWWKVIQPRQKVAGAALMAAARPPSQNGSMVGDAAPGGGSGTGGGTGGKFLSHLSSKGGGLSPVQTITLACGGIFDAAFSPDTARLAVACRDGTMRVLEWPSGQCLGGFHVSAHQQRRRWGSHSTVLCAAAAPAWRHGRCVQSCMHSSSVAT